MKNLKTFIKLLCGVALVATAVSAQAEVNNYFAPATVFDTSTLSGKSLATGTTVTGYFQPTGKELGLQIDLSAAAASTSNVVITVKKSLDKVKFDTLQTYTIALTGSTPLTLTTNITVNSVNWVSVAVSTAAISSAPLTNSTVKAFSK